MVYTAAMNRLADIAKSMTVLEQGLPELAAWLEPGQRMTGLESCVRRSKAWGSLAGEPPLVVALYGPTGAGKSTLFRLLSGVTVPSGEQMRPMSRSCAMAVPPEWNTPARLEGVFPTADICPLTDPMALVSPGQPAGRMHVALAPELHTLGPGGGSLLLVDTPDYNSVEAENARRAEEILLRAEILVFVLQVDSYLVARNVEELARAARLATRLVVLLTKTRNSEQAWAAWDDLCRRLADVHGVGAPFATRRADGKTLLEVVRAAPVHAWARSEVPVISDIVPQPGNGLPLVDVLAGYEARRVAWEGVAESAHAAAIDARRLTGLARQARSLAESRRASLTADARAAGARVAGREFPLGAVLQALVAESRSTLPDWWRVISAPVGWLMGGVETIAGVGGKLMGWISDQSGPAAPPGEPRDAVERRVLVQEAETLLDRWRARTDLKDLGLDAARCARARDTIVASQLPGVSSEWETTLRLEAARWVQENPALARALPVACDALGFAGIGLLVIDLGTTGGLFGTAVIAGTLGTGGLVAGAAGSLGFLGRWMGQWHLEEMLKRVDRAWREQRAADLGTHIDKQLVGAVAGPLDAVLRRADHERLARIDRAAECLESAARPEARGS